MFACGTCWRGYRCVPWCVQSRCCSGWSDSLQPRSQLWSCAGSAPWWWWSPCVSWWRLRLFPPWWAAPREPGPTPRRWTWKQGCDFLAQELIKWSSGDYKSKKPTMQRRNYTSTKPYNKESNQFSSLTLSVFLVKTNCWLVDQRKLYFIIYYYYFYNQLIVELFFMPNIP